MPGVQRKQERRNLIIKSTIRAAEVKQTVNIASPSFSDQSLEPELQELDDRTNCARLSRLMPIAYGIAFFFPSRKPLIKMKQARTETETISSRDESHGVVGAAPDLAYASRVGPSRFEPSTSRQRPPRNTAEIHCRQHRWKCLVCLRQSQAEQARQSRTQPSTQNAPGSKVALGPREQ